jgi:hypothetical protein
MKIRPFFDEGQRSRSARSAVRNKLPRNIRGADGTVREGWDGTRDKLIGFCLAGKRSPARLSRAVLPGVWKEIGRWVGTHCFTRKLTHQSS